MKNIRLTVEYDGTRYNGWQIQDKDQKRKGGKVKTIQGVLEGALCDLSGERIRLISSSRTDSGVHALNHIANFKSSTKLNPLKIKKALNSVLPGDIVIKEAKEADADFNAQYDAVSKTYRYSICTGDYISPFLKKYAYHFRQPLNVRLMRNESAVLLGKHDFEAFKSAGGDPEKNNFVRTIKRLSVRRKNDLIEIEIEADGFLYNMVRNIVGTLIEAGRGRFSSGSAKKILESKNRKIAGPTVPAKGLFLLDVMYTAK